MKLTEAQAKALTILKDARYDKGMSCRWFALLMWPDSNMHTTSKNTGNGSCAGKAAWLCAGSYLAKLRKKGWVSNHDHTGWYLTGDGKEQLKSILAL
jgi:hypothetical protein